MGADLAAEEQFGPYLVYERLGVGGMATVHRALERVADGVERTVALKRLLPHLAEDASFIKSFVREAKLASLLSHVNIVQIYELGRVGAAYFISMEYIDGRDVRQILRHARKVTGPPPIHVTVGIAAQLCEALDYAHGKLGDDGKPLNIVHRDVSPSNVLVTSTGHVKVIDFGIAKAESSQLRTQTGRVKGKLAYMAPEAIAGGKDLDARCDLWAVGVILHELLTARPLFASKNEYQTLLKVQKGDILPPSTYNQHCPPELDAIVFKALARDPESRFSRAGELRDQLGALRRQYKMGATAREVASWIDWAFQMDKSGTATSAAISVDAPNAPRQRTPKPPRNRDEDEAVDMVWGPSGPEDASGPLLLEEVPDVSEKHVAQRADTELADYDDIPTPVPSHGASSAFGIGERALQPVTDPGLPPRALDPALAAGTDPPKPKGSVKLAAQQGTGPIPRDAMRGSGAQRVVTRPTSPPPRRITAPGIAVQRPSDRIPAPSASPVNEHSDNVTTDPLGSPAQTDPLGSAAATDPVGVSLQSVSQLNAEELFGPDDEATLTPRPRPAQHEDETTSPEITPVADLPAVPVVRFSKSHSVPNVAAAAASGLTEPLRPTPSTKPGVAPAAPAPPNRLATPVGGTPITRARRPSDIAVGAGMIARTRVTRRWLVPVLALAVVAVGAAILVVATRDRGHSEPVQQARTTVTLKLIIEPSDAEIRIAGVSPHVGSPWSIELPAGAHPVEIRRAGYKPWVTSIEVAVEDGNQMLRVALEPLGNTAADDSASLAIATTPPGLDAVLDGKVLPDKTPIKLAIRPGPHVVAVRDHGVEVWRQNLDAEASSDYEFHPNLRAYAPARATPPRPAAPAAEPATPSPLPAATTPVKPEAEPAHLEPAPAPAPAPPAEPAKPAPDAMPSPVAPAPPAPKPAPTAPTPATAPALVAPSAVQRLTGDSPHVDKSKYTELPSIISAKLCIDTTGTVTTATVVNKIEARVAGELADTLRRWRYAPYKPAGSTTAVPACFVVPFRVE